MGLIFDVKTARLYESWRQSVQGRTSEGFFEESLVGLLNPRSGERVLDIGCGEGNHLLFCSKLGLDATGIDASPYVMSRARDRLGNRCALRHGRAEDLPFDDNEFDLALLINTMEFLDDPLQALREAGRVARRGVFIGVMNSFSCFCLGRRFRGLFGRSLFNSVRFYNLWELKTLVRTAFGDAPTAWRSAQSRLPFVGGILENRIRSWNMRHCPFGGSLGLFVSIRYTLRSEQTPLKFGIKKTEQPMAGGLTREKMIRRQRKI